MVLLDLTYYKKTLSREALVEAVTIEVVVVCSLLLFGLIYYSLLLLIWYTYPAAAW